MDWYFEIIAHFEIECSFFPFILRNFYLETDHLTE